jgi:hypothetical protein
VGISGAVEAESYPFDFVEADREELNSLTVLQRKKEMLRRRRGNQSRRINERGPSHGQSVSRTAMAQRGGADAQSPVPLPCSLAALGIIELEPTGRKQPSAGD